MSSGLFWGWCTRKVNQDAAAPNCSWNRTKYRYWQTVHAVIWGSSFASNLHRLTQENHGQEPGGRGGISVQGRLIHNLQFADDITEDYRTADIIWIIGQQAGLSEDQHSLSKTKTMVFGCNSNTIGHNNFISIMQLGGAQSKIKKIGCAEIDKAELTNTILYSTKLNRYAGAYVRD